MINYKEIAKYRTYPRQWTCRKECVVKKDITLRGTGKVIGTVLKSMDDNGGVWWIADGHSFTLLTLAGDFIYSQYAKQQKTKEVNNAKY